MCRLAIHQVGPGTVRVASGSVKNDEGMEVRCVCASRKLVGNWGGWRCGLAGREWEGVFPGRRGMVREFPDIELTAEQEAEAAKIEAVLRQILMIILILSIILRPRPRPRRRNAVVVNGCGNLAVFPG